MTEDEEDFFYEQEESLPFCPTCLGRGTVNQLTAPEGYFTVETTDCPICDGTGRVQ